MNLLKVLTKASQARGGVPMAAKRSTKGLGHPLYVNGQLFPEPVTISHVPGPQSGILGGFGVDPSMGAMGAYAAYRATPGVGDDAAVAVPSSPAATLAPAPAEPQITPLGAALVIADIALTGALAYHGYRRNKSIGWALVWAVLGGAVPIIGVPVALAQGFAEPKQKSLTPNRRRRRRARRR